MPPAYVKASVKRNKNDAADAEAVCAAVTRPSMRFVPVKEIDQQSVLKLHRARNLLIRQRTMLNLAEFGLIAPQRLAHVERQVAAIDDEQSPLPELAAVDSPARRGAVNNTQAKVRQIEAMASEPSGPAANKLRRIANR